MLYQIKAELKAIEPPIWRLLQVPSRTSLLRFHKILQRAMGWTNSHVYLFNIGGKLYGDPSPDWGLEVLDSRKVTLEKNFSEGETSFIYEYDMGDGWRHEINLLATVEAEGEEKPRCIAGARACPPEDCGGTGGYYHLLVALADPDHKDHYDMMRWLGKTFDPEAFDLAAVDLALKRLR